jgi:alpha-mannosidase
MSILHIVPHTHWDREWYLPFQTLRIKLVHLVDALLDLLAARPDYRHFTLDGQTIVVDDYLRIRPERRGELVGHVATGRLLVGPWTILPDEFLVSPESIVRNLQLGRCSALEWGGRMDVGYVPDPFGHIGQLPQILRGFGIETAAFRRGLSDEPCELWWEGPDGSRVLTAYLRDGYDNAARLPDDAEGFRAVVQRRSERLAAHSAVSHRLLLNGTDHHEAQAELPSRVADPPPDGDRWVISTLPAYLAAVREEVDSRGIDLPVVRGELRDPKRHHLLPGVLSSRVWIKQRNDRCEQLLETWAEPFVAWSALFCSDQPDRAVWTGHVETPRVRGATAFIDEAWRLLLECHPHDSICGCSVDQVHEEMRARFDQVEQIAEEVTRQSLDALARAVDTRSVESTGAVRALVVFNPPPLGGAGRVRAQVELGAGLESFEVVDAEGRVLPHRVLRRETEELANLEFPPAEIRALMRGVGDGWVAGLAVEDVHVAREGSDVGVDLVVSETGEPNMKGVEAGLSTLGSLLDQESIERIRLRARFASRVDLELAVPDLPPHGYRTLGLRASGSGDPEARTEEGTRIANDRLEVEAADDGTLTLTDRASGRKLAGLLRLRDEADRGDSYTFCPVDGDEPLEKPTRVRVTCSKGEWGQDLEIHQLLRVPARLAERRDRRSDDLVDLPVRVRVSLLPGVARADLEVTVENTAEDHRLQLLFPLGQRVAEGLNDGHYEIVRRAAGAPEGDPGWQEQPTAEQPMRAFVAATSEEGREGLLVAAHGIREASVSPEGVIALTLLRCFGWLSRDDLSTRAGGAGPTLPTPGGQCPGTHAFRLSLIPFEGDPADAAPRADAFRAGPRGAATGLHAGRLPSAASLLGATTPGFRVTALQPDPGGRSMVVRGVYLRDLPGEVSLAPLEPPTSAERVRLDGETVEPIPIDAAGRLSVRARPHEIVSVRLRYGG